MRLIGVDEMQGYTFETIEGEIIAAQNKLIQEQAELIALLKAQLQAKEEGDLCI